MVPSGESALGNQGIVGDPIPSPPSPPSVAVAASPTPPAPPPPPVLCGVVSKEAPPAYPYCEKFESGTYVGFRVG